MCGRYFISTEQDEAEITRIIKEVKDRYKNSPLLFAMKTGEIYPTDIVPVITADSKALMKWGFTRFDGKGQVINARLETVPEKPMFRKLFIEQRCLVPASWFFEWEKCGTKKHKYIIGMQETLFMAGLYRLERDIPVPTFVILTRPAAPDIAFIHDRMPVILTKDIHKAWFSEHINNLDVMNSSAVNLLYRDISE